MRPCFKALNGGEQAACSGGRGGAPVETTEGLSDQDMDAVLHHPNARGPIGDVLRVVGDQLHKIFEPQLDAHLDRLQAQMKAAAANLDFEKAAALRDDIKRLRNPELGLPFPARRA